MHVKYTIIYCIHPYTYILRTRFERSCHTNMLRRSDNIFKDGDASTSQPPVMTSCRSAYRLWGGSGKEKKNIIIKKYNVVRLYVPSGHHVRDVVTRWALVICCARLHHSSSCPLNNINERTGTAA